MTSPAPRDFLRCGLALPLAAVALLAAAPSARADDETGWPRGFDSSSGSFVIYQPQPETLSGDLLSCRAAFSLQKVGTQAPAFGVLWFTERLQIDRDSSAVNGRDLDVTRVRLPGITAAEAPRYEKLVEQEAKGWDLSGSLDELQAGLAASEKERASVADLETSPPRIVFSNQRAILVQYDGSPALGPIEGSSLQRVENTPYAVVYDPGHGDYYLSGAHLWYTSKDPLAHWHAVSAPPAAVASVVPPDTSSSDRIEGEPPVVLTATEPTELISCDGPPDYAPLAGGELLFVTNTESDVFREIKTQSIFVLLAGRWYRAASPDGPWTFVRSDQLPDSFRRVSSESPKAEILASIAGTEQADDAVADAEIPQTSAIRRDSTDVQVAYDDDPQFEAVEGTDLQYAVNTDSQVILADGRYYLCDQGVWYVSDYADGPWSVSETRPLEVDDIPPSCPVYNVRYVYIYEVTPDVIYMGYLPGYVGCFPYYGTVVYGTGYHYRPWRRHHYFPRPFTWGFFPHYNPWLSRWSFGYSYCSGFFRTGYRWNHEPRFRHYAPLWFGPGGYHRPLYGADQKPVRSRDALKQRQRSSDVLPMNLYNRSTNVSRVVRTVSQIPAHGVRPFPAKPVGLPNNVLAGKDGKVYRRAAPGNWQVNQGRKWVPTRDVEPKPTAPDRADGTAPGSKGGGRSPGDRPTPPPSRPETPPKQTHDAPPARSEPPQRQPRTEPPAHPAPPPLSRKPGDLEREYHARERGGSTKPSEAPPPAQRAEPQRRDQKPPEARQPETKPPDAKQQEQKKPEPKKPDRPRGH
ncbi:MAG: carbohydrate-binding family V/XII [bacterium]